MNVSLFEQMVAPKENRYENRNSFSFLVLVAVAVLFRFLGLGLKPPHFDEGINGHFVITIWRDGFYSYDPTNFHGPLYFYICHLGEVLFGRGVESFRLMTAALSFAVVLSVYRLRQYLGRTAVVAAWILAVSPAFTFYGRYAIHESLFILGQVLFVHGRFAWFSQPSRRAITLMVVAIVILASTKETFFIFLGTWLIAEFCIRFLERREAGRTSWGVWPQLEAPEKKKIRLEIIGICLLGTLAMAALYSGFFERPQGVLDFFKAFDVWSKTGTKGNGHEKPFLYWAQLLWRYEWPLLLGLIGAAYATVCLRVENRRLRILLLCGFGHFLAYSIIPYKTPWLLLSFWPLAFFVLPAWTNLRAARTNRAVYLVYLALAVSLGVSTYQAYQMNFKNFAKQDEPYVYVQTTSDYTAAMQLLRKKGEQSPDVRNGSVVVMIQDPWPLPYDLSGYPKMRYAKIEDIDRDVSIVRNATVMLIDGSILQGLQNIVPKRFAKLPFQLRGGALPGWALFDYDTFQSVLPPGTEILEPKSSQSESAR